MAEFEYYPFGVYGTIPIINDGVLLQKILACDNGMPLVSSNDVIGRETLTPAGEELQGIVNDLNVNFQVLTNGSGGYISTSNVKNAIQSGIRKVFTNCKLSFKSAGKVPTPVQPVPEVPLWVKSQNYEFYDRSGDVPAAFNYDVFSSQFKNPPTGNYLGQLLVTGMQALSPGVSIQTGFIVCDSVNQSSYWFNLIYGTRIDSEKLFRTTSFRCEPQLLDYQLVSQIIANIQPVNQDDPFGDDPNAEDSGGNGDNDESSDNVDEPGIPGLDATDTSFVSIYNPTPQNLRGIFNYVWAGDWFGEDADPLVNIAKSIKFSIVDPLSALLGLMLIPVKPQTGQSRDVKLGWLNTGVSVPQVTNQFVKFNCGSIYIPNFYNTFLDYSPHTKYTLYLPFIGSQTLESDQITGKTLQVSYTFDVMTGGCTAFVKADNSVIGQFQGSCQLQLPLSSSNFSEIANTIMQIPTSGQKFLYAGKAGGWIGQQIGQTGQQASTVVNSLKQDINVSGTIKGDAGYMAVRQPYLTITRPNMVYTPPGARQKLIGYPSGEYVQLSELSGFTKVLYINTNTLNVPIKEAVDMIEEQLKIGVYL